MARIDRDLLNKIYVCDCLEGMRALIPDRTVDVVVTSPPYNIGVEYHQYRDDLDFRLYRAWLAEVMSECSRVLKDDGSIFLNLGDRPSDGLKVFDLLQAFSHLKVQNTIHWVKSIAAPEQGLTVGHYRPVNSDRFLHDAHEYIFHLTKTGNVQLNKLAIGCPYADKSNIGRYAEEDVRCRGNVWYIPYDTVTSAKAHPAAFPILLPKRCILLHHTTKRRKLVLDPFMGEGTTAAAASMLKVDFVGFEIDPQYADVAQKNYGVAVERQPRLPQRRVVSRYSSRAFLKSLMRSLTSRERAFNRS